MILLKTTCFLVLWSWMTAILAAILTMVSVGVVLASRKLKYEVGDLHWLHKAISNLKTFFLGTTMADAPSYRHTWTNSASASTAA